MSEIAFVYKESKEIWVISKSLISFWILWLLYWKFDISITQFLWVEIQWGKNVIWFIGFVIVFEIFHLLIYLYRDLVKLKLEWIDAKIWKKRNVKIYLEKIENEQNSKNINETRLENFRSELDWTLRNNSLVHIQIIQKNIIFIFLKILLPICIWIVSLRNIWPDSLLLIINKFDYIDSIILILFLLIWFIWINKYLKKED